jgi:outer membrane protein TolC
MTRAEGPPPKGGMTGKSMNAGSGRASRSGWIAPEESFVRAVCKPLDDGNGMRAGPLGILIVALALAPGILSAAEPQKGALREMFRGAWHRSAAPASAAPAVRGESPPPAWQPGVRPATSVRASQPVVQQVAAEQRPADPPPAVDEVPPRQAYPIDLATALRLADAQNPQVAFARERVRQAVAQRQAAEVLWLPSLRGGLSYALHEGTLQDSAGAIIDTHRQSIQAGSGAFAFGAGPPMLPGLSADFHLTDALFQPLAARRAVDARQAASRAASNDMLLSVARGYLELQRAYADVVIAEELAGNTRQLRSITDAFAKAGKGPQADADRVQAEDDLRANELWRYHEGRAVTSSRLTRLLRLDQSLILEPADERLAPLDLEVDRLPLEERIAVAQASRPELAETGHLIQEAYARLERERYAPLVPTVSMGMTYSGFGGSGAGTGYDFSDRTDFQAVAYWQLRNLGMGDRAAQRDRQSILRQQCLLRQTMLDQVAQEVAEAHAQVQFRERQIKTAEHAVKAAADSYGRNLERIRGGEGLPIEVLQSISALGQARREHVRAITDYNAAQFALQRAMGVFLTPPSH